MRVGFVEAGDVLCRALGFFGRRYLVIAAFGALASAQRFLAVSEDERFAFAAGAGGEIFTAAVRLAFLGWLAHTLLGYTPVPWSQAGARLSRFAEARWPMLVASGVILVALTVVFKGIPDAAIAGLAEENRARARSWELAVKNVTIIPFVMTWLTMIVRVALDAGATLAAPEPTSAPRRPAG
ncbi:hypothetical protein I6A84_43530 [Frankia sp. CNm7]|nr:hypothetical protein [Frankia nepalensis]